jgi:hypothetical protein
MKATSGSNWHDANQSYLMAALDVVRGQLQWFASSRGKPESHRDASPEGPSKASQALVRAAENMPAAAALDSLTAIFNLTPFERNVLLMCAGIELDASFAALLASLNNGPARPNPTFSLALAALPDAHWSAILPNAALRYWRLVEPRSSERLTTSPLFISERVLHFLTGFSHLDEQLTDILVPVSAEEDLVASHMRLAEQVAATLAQPRARAKLPVIQLCGNEEAGKAAIAADACGRLGLDLYRLSAFDIPASSREVADLIRLWEREVVLSGRALFLDCSEIDPADTSRLHQVANCCQRTQSPIIISSVNQRLVLHPPMIAFKVNKPTAKEQMALWMNAFGSESEKLKRKFKLLTAQFDMETDTIRSTISNVRGGQLDKTLEHPDGSDGLSAKLWDACRAHTRPRLDDLAQRLIPVSSWDDIVLPPQQKRLLGQIAIQVRGRMQVYQEWGCAAKNSRGLGISALFTGESGTGKTMASEVLANELRLDLYRIDLSQVVNKYIGETEKNLKRIFDAAEEGGAILLFDEADALFGKRSEVKDSHDRYANIEVSYLLQRMETYRGLAILTTNMKSALDKAFLRRIRFVVQFPFPDAAHRAAIWRSIFPKETPTHDLDVEKLSRLNVAGGNICNIALNAAFLAAEEGAPVRMRHLSHAAQAEYRKIEKAMSNVEIGSWE